MTSAVRELSKHPASIESKARVTAQHCQTLAQVTANVLTDPDGVIAGLKPDRSQAEGKTTRMQVMAALA